MAGQPASPKPSFVCTWQLPMSHPRSARCRLRKRRLACTDPQQSLMTIGLPNSPQSVLPWNCCSVQDPYEEPFVTHQPRYTMSSLDCELLDPWMTCSCLESVPGSSRDPQHGFIPPFRHVPRLTFLAPSIPSLSASVRTPKQGTMTT
jgi:hypothetical protein